MVLELAAEDVADFGEAVEAEVEAFVLDAEHDAVVAVVDDVVDAAGLFDRPLASPEFAGDVSPAFISGIAIDADGDAGLGGWSARSGCLRWGSK